MSFPSDKQKNNEKHIKILNCGLFLEETGRWHIVPPQCGALLPTKRWEFDSICMAIATGRDKMTAHRRLLFVKD